MLILLVCVLACCLHQFTKPTVLLQRVTVGVGSVAEWYCLCLAYARCWVQSSAPKNKKDVIDEVVKTTDFIKA